MAIVFDLTQNEMDVDWIRAARLKEKAAKGDKEASKELARMQTEKMEEHPENVG